MGFQEAFLYKFTEKQVEETWAFGTKTKFLS